MPAFHRLTAAELRDRLAAPRPPLVLDVRRGEAFSGPPGILGAQPFPLDVIPARLPDLDRDSPIVLYCL